MQEQQNMFLLNFRSWVIGLQNTSKSQSRYHQELSHTCICQIHVHVLCILSTISGHEKYAWIDILPPFNVNVKAHANMNLVHDFYSKRGVLMVSMNDIYYINFCQRHTHLIVLTHYKVFTKSLLLYNVQQSWVSV